MADDRLAEALRALREDVHGRTENPERELARVLGTARQRRRRRWRRWKVGIPIAAVLAGSSAWATMGGGWSSLRAQVVELFRGEQDETLSKSQELSDASTQGRLSAKENPPASRVGSEEPGDTLSSGSVPQQGVQRQPGTGEEESSSKVERAKERGTEPAVEAGAKAAHPSRASTKQPSPWQGGSNEAEDACDSNCRLALEKADFEKAFRVHSEGRAYEAAIAAWDEYLKRHPSGRFVPEARYARAVALARAGQREKAREALRPFAEASAGSYRQDDARRLLEQLDAD